MLAKRLVTSLLGELVLYVLLVVWQVRSGGLELWQILLVVLGLAVGVRMLIVAGMFAVSECWKCKRPEDKKIGLLKFLRLYFLELRSLALLYTLYLPCVRYYGLLNPPEEAQKNGAPVVLVHGFMCNAGYWRPMRTALAAAGITNVWAINLEPLNGNIERLADQLAARVEDICSKTGAEKVALVGHSMGGLVSRTFARRPEGQTRVAQIISMGSPYHGTIHSVFSNARNARQMRINNDWLNELNMEEEHPAAVPITSLFSYHDNIVSPQDSPMLKHAENIGFAGIGHLGMSFSKEFQQKLVEKLLETR